jgi:CRP/FNR family transcriptional regulator
LRTNSRLGRNEYARLVYPHEERPQASAGVVTHPQSPRSNLDELANKTRQLLRPYLHIRQFKKGSLLWREGETLGLLVAIKTGRVKVYRLLPTGRAVTLFLFGPGDICGFLPFLDGAPYPAHAQAIEDVEAEVLPRSALSQALRAEPELAAPLIALLGHRLREAMDLIQRLSTPGARSRVAAAVLALIPEAPGSEPVIRLPVTAQEFAGAIGITPETFSRALTHLERNRVLEREGGGRYRVLDLERLKQAAAPPVD